LEPKLYFEKTIVFICNRRINRVFKCDILKLSGIYYGAI